MSISRYWRVVGFSLPYAETLELSEARIYENGELADLNATFSVTVAPSSGAIEHFYDGLATAIVSWPSGSHKQPGFALQWDFGIGGGVEVPVLQFGSGSSSATFPTSVILQRSDNNSIWNTYQSVNGIIYPGAMSLTGLTPLESFLSATHIRLVCFSAQTENNYYRVGEVEVSLLSGGANLCVGGTASGNGDYFPASKAFDGVINGISTNAWAGSPGYGRTLQYAFGALKEFSFLRVINGGPTDSELNQTLKDYDIETSIDGTTWVKRAEVRNRESISNLVTEHMLLTQAILPNVGIDATNNYLQKSPITYSDADLGASTIQGSKPPYVFLDAYFGGYGLITGTVKEKSIPSDSPLHRKVWLIDEASGMVIRETWSNATNGYYEFRGIKQGVKYTVLAYDHTETYRAVVADRVLPEAMP